MKHWMRSSKLSTTINNEKKNEEYDKVKYELKNN